jgi:hypothetical protein
MRAREKPRKTLRKSRNSRVRSSISSEWLNYEPSRDDWIAMEVAIQRPINCGLRDEIVEIVQCYFRVQTFEANAPFVKDVLERLNSIRQTVQKLQQTLDFSLGDSVIENVRIQLEQNLDGGGLHSIDTALESLLQASHFAEEKLQEQADCGFSEGEAWQEMVGSLRALMRSNSMPFRASPANLRAKDPKGSPFVQFVQSLQKTFPADFLRRHHLSDPFSLAKQINRSARIRTLKRKRHSY